jgi:hypothetical protein
MERVNHGREKKYRSPMLYDVDDDKSCVLIDEIHTAKHGKLQYKK